MLLYWHMCNELINKFSFLLLQSRHSSVGNFSPRGNKRYVCVPACLSLKIFLSNLMCILSQLHKVAKVITIELVTVKYNNDKI